MIKWRKRYFEEGIDGLVDRKRSGRPRRFSPSGDGRGQGLACELPATTGVPLSKWSCAELAREVVDRTCGCHLGGHGVADPHHDAIRPWLHRSWIFPRDPDFAAKAAVVLDLYARVFEGKPWRNGVRDLRG